jgi:hypothetical protein
MNKDDLIIPKMIIILIKKNQSITSQKLMNENHLGKSLRTLEIVYRCIIDFIYETCKLYKNQSIDDNHFDQEKSKHYISQTNQ